MKDFFSKVWTWILNHKIIAIVVASVLVVGTTCAIVLPIALHEHSYATEWSSDAENHWHDATCKHEEEKSDLAAHTYTNACDTTCDVCGYARTVGAHVYDNACDTACNVCGATREITHAHSTTLTADEITHYYLCSVCGDKKDEAAHVFDKTVASSEYLKAEATATTKTQYWKSCVCGAKSATEYFESDKTTATLTNIQDLSKTYDKVELANPTYETNSDGAVTIEWYQGDTKLDAKPVNAGIYKVKIIIAESATYTGVSDEKEFTIEKKTIAISALEKEYDGSGNFVFTYDELGEEIDCSITIGNKDAGTYTDVEILNSSVSYVKNYEITATTVSAKINPKVLNDVTHSFIYNGNDYHQVYLTSENHNGIIGSDQVMLEVIFESENVGAAVLTSDPELVPVFEEGNYILGTYSFSIVKKIVTSLPAILTAEYNGTNSLVATVEIDGIEGTLTFDATKDSNPISTVGEYTGVSISNYSLGDNFGITLRSGTYTVKIVPKKITGLDLKVTKDTYNGGYFVLLKKDGIVESNSLIPKITITTLSSLEVGDKINLVLDESNLGPGCEKIAWYDSSLEDFYQLVADENGVVGTLTIVSECDIQDDASCNCGQDHRVTLTVGTAYTVNNQGINAGETDYFRVEISETGFYTVTDAIEGSDDSWASITVTDSEGNVLQPNSSGKYLLTVGTTLYIKTVATNQLDYDTVTITVKKV